MRLCEALDNLNRSRLIFSREPLDGSNFISRPQRIEGLRVHAGEEVTPQRPLARKAVHKRDSSSLVIDTGNCLSGAIMAPNASSYQQ